MHSNTACDDSAQSSSSSSATRVLYRGISSGRYDHDERIGNLLGSLRLTSLRHKTPRDDDTHTLRKLHRQLEWLVNEETDEQRRRRLRHILPAANCVREQVFALRHFLHNMDEIPGDYVTNVHAALTAIMKESFEEEYRKLATVVGVLEAVAELLILEVDAFGIDCPNENRTIRKLIASTLTNLTFGNAQSKRRLCTHPTLIEYVVKIVDVSHALAQVYAGLLRNLSWMADAEMSAALSPSVPALCRASLCAYRGVEAKCLCATLSALWNLASHSRDNKKAICDEPGLLDMIIELLVNDAKQTVIVEPASGILKYASMYLAVVGAEQYLSSSALHTMMLRLIDLLNSPSFTIIGNSLGVLSQLLAKNNQLRHHLRTNQKAMHLLSHLRNSTREDIRNPIRTVMGYLNAVDLSYSQPYGNTSTISCRLDGMSSSYGGSVPSYYDSSRLLKLRSAHQTPCVLSATNTSGGVIDAYGYTTSYNAAAQHSFAPRPGDRPSQQYASLPRQYFQHSKVPSASTSRNDTDFFEQTNTTSFTRPLMSPPSNASRPLVKDASTATSLSGTSPLDNNQDEAIGAEIDETALNRLHLRSDDPSFDVEDSVRCTRCTSAQSLSSLLPGERSAWDSCNNSAVESNRLSPLSSTDIPDSPTQFASRNESATVSTGGDNDQVSDRKLPESDALFATKTANEPSTKNDQNQLNTTTTKSLIVEENEKDGRSIGSIGSEARQDSLNDDGDYSSLIGQADSDLLNQSIEAAMPKRNKINEDFLAEMIEQVQPKSPATSARQFVASNAQQYLRTSTAKARFGCNTKTDDDDFLLQSIASVLPARNPSRSPLKKIRPSMNSTSDPFIHIQSSPRNWTNVMMTEPSASSRGGFVTQGFRARPGTSALEKSRYTDQIAGSTISAELFEAALQNSSFVENIETQEKVRDASMLRHHTSNESGDPLSDDNYSPISDRNMVMEKNLPFDVDEEYQAEQLIIDCKVISETTKQTTVKSTRKTSKDPPVASHLSVKTGECTGSNSEYDSCVLPAPLSSSNGSPVNSFNASAKVSTSTRSKTRENAQNFGNEKFQDDKCCPSTPQVSALPRPKLSSTTKSRQYAQQSRSCSNSRSESKISGTIKQHQMSSTSRQSRTAQRHVNTAKKDEQLRSIRKFTRVLPFNRGSNGNEVPNDVGNEINLDDENGRNRGDPKKKTINQIFVTTV